MYPHPLPPLLRKEETLLSAGSRGGSKKYRKYHPRTLTQNAMLRPPPPSFAASFPSFPLVGPRIALKFELRSSTPAQAQTDDADTSVTSTWDTFRTPTAIPYYIQVAFLSQTVGELLKGKPKSHKNSK